MESQWDGPIAEIWEKKGFEIGIKPQTNKQTNKQSMSLYTFTTFVLDVMYIDVASHQITLSKQIN